MVLVSMLRSFFMWARMAQARNHFRALAHAATWLGQETMQGKYWHPAHILVANCLYKTARIKVKTRCKLNAGSCGILVSRNFRPVRCAEALIEY